MKYYNDILILAAKLHRGQFRKDGTTPYIIHPIRVSLKVKESIEEAGYGNYTAVYSALLHDTIEDTSVNFSSLGYLLCASMMHGNKIQKDNNYISSAIVNNVLFLTKEKYDGYNRHALNDIYLRQVLSGGYEVVLIKLCDRIDNIRDLNTIITEDFKKLYISETKIMAQKVFEWLQVHQYDEHMLHSVTQKRLKELENLVK